MIPSHHHHRTAERRALAAGGVALAVAVVVLVGVAPAGLLCLVPSALIGALLLLGRFPGERVLIALARRRAPRRARAALGRARASAALPARGGGLVAAGLAGRAPPALLTQAP